MTAVQVGTPDTAALRARLRDLTLLQRKVAAEVNETRERLLLADTLTGIYRRRLVQPPCDTEAGYQWHRYHDRDQWPLPADDPCGCRAAHARHNAARATR